MCLGERSGREWCSSAGVLSLLLQMRSIRRKITGTEDTTSNKTLYSLDRSLQYIIWKWHTDLIGAEACEIICLSWISPCKMMYNYLQASDVAISLYKPTWLDKDKHDKKYHSNCSFQRFFQWKMGETQKVCVLLPCLHKQTPMATSVCPSGNNQTEKTLPNILYSMQSWLLTPLFLMNGGKFLLWYLQHSPILCKISILNLDCCIEFGPRSVGSPVVNTQVFDGVSSEEQPLTSTPSHKILDVSSRLLSTRPRCTKSTETKSKEGLWNFWMHSFFVGLSEMWFAVVKKNEKLHLFLTLSIQ